MEDYLAHLPPWDGTDHIAALAHRVTVSGDSDLWALCLRKWFVALVASMQRPGEAVNQAALILLGRQGIFKSTFFRHILPPELRPYYLEKSNSTRMNKDDKLSLTEYILIGLEEMDSMGAKELNQLKALMTTAVINERAAYAKIKTKRPHLASFCGTGNNIELLTDPTGNRRFLTFEALAIVNPHTHPLPYPQLYAQALHLIGRGYEHWLSHDEIARLTEHQRHFLAHSDELELLLRYYAKPDHEAFGTWVEYADILHYIVQQERYNISGAKLQQALKQANFDRKRSNGKTQYFVQSVEL